MQIHMQFGQVDPLEALVTDFEGTGAVGWDHREACVRARNRLGSAERPQLAPSRRDRSRLSAFERINTTRRRKRKRTRDPKYKKKPSKRHAQLDAFPATHDGASLAEIQDLADVTDLKLQMARRQDPERVNPNAVVGTLERGTLRGACGRT